MRKVVTPPKKRQKRVSGDIVRIPLSRGHYSFAWVLPTEVAFFDHRTRIVLPMLEELISCPVAFRLHVMNSAITKGRWQVIGNRTPPADLLVPHFYFREDPLSQEYFLTIDGSRETQTTRKEAAKHERAAVWSAEHVESRLKDHYLGRPNAFVESLRPRL